MTAKDMILEDAMETAIRSEKKRIITRRLFIVSAGLNVLLGIMLLLATKRH